MADQTPRNTWQQVGPGGVFISRYYSQGRTPYFMGWAVKQRGQGGRLVRLDPNAHWAAYGAKVFSAFGENDRGKAALERAKAWATEQFGITEWKRNRMGDYVDASLPPLRKVADRG